MKYLHIFAFVLLQCYSHARVITTNLEERQDIDVYRVEEDTDKHTITLINPKSSNPTLREIIYYHVIEKPYGQNTMEPTQPPFLVYPSVDGSSLPVEGSGDTSSMPVDESVDTTTLLDETVDVTPMDVSVDVTTSLEGLNDVLVDETTVQNDDSTKSDDITEVPVVDMSNDGEVFDNSDIVLENNADNIFNATVDEVKPEDVIKENTDENKPLDDVISDNVGVKSVGDIDNFNESELSEIIPGEVSERPIEEDDITVTTNMPDESNVESDIDFQLPNEMSNSDPIFNESEDMIPKVDLLSRKRRDISDAPHTYGMALDGNHGTVWNDVSARNIKYEVGNDDEIIQDDDAFIPIANEETIISEDSLHNDTEVATDIMPDEVPQVEENPELVDFDLPEIKENPKEELSSDILPETNENPKLRSDVMPEVPEIIEDSEVVDDALTEEVSEIKENPEVKDDVLTEDVSEMKKDSEVVDDVMTEDVSEIKEKSEVVDDVLPEEIPEIKENSDIVDDVLPEDIPEINKDSEVVDDVLTEDVSKVKEDSEVVDDVLPEEVPEIKEGSMSGPIMKTLPEDIENLDGSTPDGSDTKQWGMSLNSETGTIWNDFNGKPIEYQVGNGNAVPDMPDTYPEDSSSPIESIGMPETEEPISTEITDASIPDVEESEDVFVTPPSRDLPEPNMFPTEDILEDIPEGPTLPPLDLDNLPNFDTDMDVVPEETTTAPLEEELIEDATDSSIIPKNLPIDDMDETTDLFYDTTSIPEDIATTENSINVEDDTISDDITELMKNPRFMSWVQTWAASYSEMIKNKINEIVKEEVKKQIEELDLDCCRKSEIVEDDQKVDQVEPIVDQVEPIVDQVEPVVEQDKLIVDKAQAKVESKIIYGNSVGNENVTNIFMFMDNVSDKIMDILKPIMTNDVSKVHFISAKDETATEIITEDVESTTQLPEDFDIPLDNLDEETVELTTESLERNYIKH